MRKLTQREKILVYIAAVLLLLTGGYYLVEQPAEMRRVRTETELKILQLQERESEDSLTGKSTLEEEIGREQDMAGENTEDYLPYRTNSVLISELAEYLTSFGIVPETMKVESVSVLEEQETTEAGYHIHRADIHVEALGTMEELYRLLDWAYDRDWISVTTYSGEAMEDKDAGMNGAADDTGENETGDNETLSMTFTCFMLELKNADETKNAEEPRL